MKARRNSVSTARLASVGFSGTILRIGPDAIVRLSDLAEHIGEIDPFRVIEQNPSKTRDCLFTLYYRDDKHNLRQRRDEPQEIVQWLRRKRFAAFKKHLLFSNDEDKTNFLIKSAQIIYVSARWAADVIARWNKSATLQDRVKALVNTAKAHGSARQQFSLNVDPRRVKRMVEDSRTLTAYKIETTKSADSFTIYISQAA